MAQKKKVKETLASAPAAKTTAISVSLANDPVIQYLAANPDFDLLQHDFYQHRLKNHSKKKAVQFGDDGLIEKVKVRQRLMRIWPDQLVAAKLEALGYDSAARIAGTSKWRFIKQTTTTLDTDAEPNLSAKIYVKACAINSKMKHVYANIHSDVASPHYQSALFNNVQDSLVAYTQGIPSYQSLFGNLDFCKCDECSSIFSPAAYFLDTMRITDEYITECNTGIPQGMKLVDRRPDLFNIKLTCANTNVPVATVQIINEVMEARLEAAQQVSSGTAQSAAKATIVLASSASATDGAYSGMLIYISAGTGSGQLQTVTDYVGATKTATVVNNWDTLPDNTSTYTIMKDIYGLMAISPYPFNLPYNLPLKQSRLYAASLGTSLTDIYSAFLSPVQWGTVQSATATTIVFATTVQPFNGSYINMLIDIPVGCEAGKSRRIIAYDAATKTATIAQAWATTPQANSQYYLSNPGPVLNESLGLSVEQADQLITPLTAGATLSAQYGFNNLADANLIKALTPLAEFMWRSHLKRAEVASLFNQQLNATELAAGLANKFYINDTNENLPYLQFGFDTTGAEPIEIIQNLSIKRLDRLNRFIRLASETGWSYAVLNWVMQACDAQEITSLLLYRLALVKILSNQTALSPETICSFWYIMKNTGGMGVTKPQDLFDQVYNNPSLLKGQNPYASASYIPFDPYNHPDQQWNITDNSELNSRIRSRLLAALGLNDNELTQVAMFVFSQVTKNPQKGSASIVLSYENLSWLYRITGLARLSALSIDAFLVYLSVAFYPDAVSYTEPAYGSFVPTFDLALTVFGKIEWLKKSGFDPYQLQYIFNGTISPQYKGASYSVLDVQKFVQSLAVISESSRFRKESFVNDNVTTDESAVIFEHMVAAGYINEYGILLNGNITFAESSALFPVNELDFVTANINSDVSKTVFTLLTQTPAANPYLLNPFVKSGIRYATLNEQYYAYSPLDFLFVSLGQGQQGDITAYAGATRTATVGSSWVTVPNNSSCYAVSVTANQGTAQAGTDYAITLATSASEIDGAYNGMVINISSGKGSGQQNDILSYNSTTREAGVALAWTIVPDNTSVYIISNVLNSGFAQSATANTIVLDTAASEVDDVYNKNQLSIITDPKAELQRAEVRKRLMTFRDNILHTASLVTQFEQLQNENCLQALAGFMHTTADLVSVLLPFAGSVTDLTSYLAALLSPVPAEMLQSFLPAVNEQSFASNLIKADESAQTFALLKDKLIIIVNEMPSYLPTTGTVSTTFTVATSLDFLFDKQDQAELKRAYVKAVLLLSQRAYLVNLLVQALARSMVLVDRTGLTSSECKFILAQPGCCDIINIDRLTLDNVISITLYKGLVTAFNNQSDALNLYFNLPKQALLPNAKTAALSGLTGWDSAQLCALIPLLWPNDNADDMHTSYGSVLGVARLKACFDQSTKTGIDIFNLLNVTALSNLPLSDGAGGLLTANWLTYGQASQLLLGAARAKLGSVAFTSADTTIQKTLLASKRDALLNYLIWQLNASTNLSFIRTPADLYQYLLLDVEMGTCDNSSYIAQGIASVQLYLQRCRMMLEAGITDLSNIGDAWWEWMMAYRVWEANRRIFLYPENYIDPSLYTYQSPAFKKFSEALQQTNIDDQSVTAAYTAYMTDFTIVSNLVQCASYKATLHDDQSGKDIERLFIFGHTNDQPYDYYYRTFDNQYSWLPWQEMKITIGSQFVSPVYAFKRLFIFWTELTFQSGSTVVSNSSVPNSSTISSIKFSYLNEDGSWITPQVLQENIVVDYKTNYDFDAYVKLILPLYTSQFSPDLIFWRKVYPLYMPQKSIFYPDKYPNTESIAVCYGFGMQTIPGQVVPLPEPPAKKMDPAQYQLEHAAWSMVTNYSNVSKVDQPGQGTFVNEQPGIIIDSGLTKQSITPVFLNYRPLANPTPYIPYLYRGGAQLGVNPSISLNIIIDNYYSDNVAAYPTPQQTAAPQLPLLNNISPNTTSITTVKNIVGSFIFDNGDETFLVASQEQGIQNITDTLSSDYNYQPFPAGNFYFFTDSYTQTPTTFNQLKFGFTRISTRTGIVFSRKLIIGGVDELLTVESQQTPELTFNRLAPQAAVIPPSTDILDFNGAYGSYFSEIFFHAPFLVAYTLNTHQRFNDAKKWYEYVFNPTQQSGEELADPKDRFWRYLPFRNMDLPTLIQTLTNPAEIAAYNDDPFSPDAIARLRPSAYAKAIVMKYINNIIMWADNLYAQDTRETINQATNLYLLASELLGKRPELINSCPKPKPMSFNDIKAMYNNKTISTGTAQSATSHSIVLGTGSANQNDAYTGMYIQITGGTGSNQSNYITAYNGNTLTATLAEPWPVVPNNTSVYRIYLDNIPQFFINLENSAFNDPNQLVDYTGMVYNDIPSYFCVPENSELTGYWDLIEDRLYKIRHCMNLKGDVRELALFAPPIDPRLLIAAAAGGNAGMITASQAGVPIPAFRFDTMIEKARSFTANVIQFGAILLNALEKKDNEMLAVLQNTQQRVLLDMNTMIREQQVNMYIANGAALQESLLAANDRYNYYSALVEGGLNVGEILNITGMTAAMGFNVASSMMTAASSIAYLIPNVGSPFAMTYGGEQIGSSLSAAASVLGAGAVISEFVAQLSLTVANYQRRAEDWGFQAKQAQFDTLGITYQLQSNTIQQKIAEQEIKVQEKTINQNQELALFYRDKFTNADLYQWMVTRLSTVYYQAYTLAYELATEAQRAYQYELNTNQSFINFGYWDNLKKGLLAGEGLSLSLMQMEKSWVDNNLRTLEIEKTISLQQLDPIALLQLIETGECLFNLSEKLFDNDYPGHYARKIKSVAISIPAVLGPYQDFHVMLSQLTSQVILKPDLNAVNFLLGGSDAVTPLAEILRSNWNVSQSIAISGGVNDSGLFELNFQDQRYLPFEGTGAVSGWRLSMPKSSNLFNFETISDIIIQLKYTAFNGGNKFRGDVLKLNPMRSRNGSRFFNMAQNFSQQWYVFMNIHSSTTDQTLLFSVDSLQPPHIDNPVMTGFYIELDVPVGTNTQGSSPYLTLKMGKSLDVTFNLTANNNCMVALNNPLPVSNILGNASLNFILANTPSDIKTTSTPVYLDERKVLNATIVIFWAGENSSGK